MAPPSIPPQIRRQQRRQAAQTQTASSGSRMSQAYAADIKALRLVGERGARVAEGKKERREDK